MSGQSTSIEVKVATEPSEQLVAAFQSLIPQVSTSATPLDFKALAEIIAAPCNTVLLAYDRDKGGEIVGALTLVIFRIPTAIRAWIENLVVDSAARRRGVGEALTGC